MNWYRLVSWLWPGRTCPIRLLLLPLSNIVMFIILLLNTFYFQSTKILFPANIKRWRYGGRGGRERVLRTVDYNLFSSVNFVSRH
jgi:hypothetical protein